MLDLLSMISGLKRPGLLIRAARLGVEEYDRARHLPRLLRLAAAPKPGTAVIRLLEIEAEIDTSRRRKAADYSVARHLDVLIALLGEARIIRAGYEPRTGDAEAPRPAQPRPQP